MSLENDNKIRKYLEKCDNPFLAIRELASIARDRANQYNNIISHSEALTWVVQNKTPEQVSRFGELKNRSYKQQYYMKKLKEVLCYIDDNKIKEAVTSSFRESIKNRYLIYNYQNIVEDPKKARVRILTNLLWYDKDKEN